VAKRRSDQPTESDLDYLKALREVPQWLTLQELSRWSKLNLSCTEATDAGLAHIKSLDSLEWLSLSRTAVTDGGLSQIAGLVKLRALYVRASQLSRSDEQALTEALPGLKVQRSHPIFG